MSAAAIRHDKLFQAFAKLAPIAAELTLAGHIRCHNSPYAVGQY